MAAQERQSKATQLTITIPDGVPPGTILSIPVRGGTETIKARVPEGLGAGSTLVLTKHDGTDHWVEEIGEPMPPGNTEPVAVDEHLTFAAPPSHAPGACAGGPPSGVPEPGFGSGPIAYTVRLDTTAGIIDIIVRPDWAPHGARRFLDLAAAGDLDDLAFYRSVKGCLAQFGLPPRRQWPPLPDDPESGVPFLLGAVCFAAVGPNSRKSTLFVCTGDMSHCFGQQPYETPIGAVTEASLDVLDRIETIYGDIHECGGTGPDTSRIHAEGNAYLRANFPLLTYIRQAWPLDWEPPEGDGLHLPAACEPVLQEVASNAWTGACHGAAAEPVAHVEPVFGVPGPGTPVESGAYPVSHEPEVRSSTPTRTRARDARPVSVPVEVSAAPPVHGTPTACCRTRPIMPSASMTPAVEASAPFVPHGMPAYGACPTEPCAHGAQLHHGPQAHLCFNQGVFGHPQRLAQPEHPPQPLQPPHPMHAAHPYSASGSVCLPHVPSSVTTAPPHEPVGHSMRAPFPLLGAPSAGHLYAPPSMGHAPHGPHPSMQAPGPSYMGAPPAFGVPRPAMPCGHFGTAPSCSGMGPSAIRGLTPPAMLQINLGM